MFSHEFQYMPVEQVLNKLEGKEPGDFILIRRNRGQNGEIDMRPDYFVNDDIYRPYCQDDISFYEFAENYDRIVLSFHMIKDENCRSKWLVILNDCEL